MHIVARSSLGSLGILLSVGCSSTSSPVDRDRSQVIGVDAGDGRGGESEASGESLGSDVTTFPDATAEQSAVEPPDETTIHEATGPAPTGATSSGPTSSELPGETTTSNTEAGHWALVRSEDSGQEFVEHWTYDDAARLVDARVIRVRRDLVPYYAVDITLTYDGDHVTSVHDALPEDAVDLTYEYELEEGRIAIYTQAVDGELNSTQTFEYDAEGRLIGSRESYSGYESVWTLSRRPSGDPSELSQDGRVLCAYSWRHIWLGTTCYTDGVAAQIYEPDADGRLGRMILDDVSVEYGYDDAGRLTFQTSGANVYEYRYSADGKLVESTGFGNDELRTYDERGLLTAVSWKNGSDTRTTTFTYERVSGDEVIETETSADRTVVRTYRRLSHAPTVEPLLPSYWTLLHMDQPNVYIAPTDYSQVP